MQSVRACVCVCLNPFDFQVMLNVCANPFAFRRRPNHSVKSVNCFVKSVLRDDDDEDGEKAAQRQNNRSMLAYFGASAGSNDQNPTHRFFTERRLKSLDTL